MLLSTEGTTIACSSFDNIFPLARSFYLGFSIHAGLLRVFLPVAKKNWCSSINLNRRVPHWSNVFFIAEHSEMIKIFRFIKNHKKPKYIAWLRPFYGW